MSLLHYIDDNYASLDYLYDNWKDLLGCKILKVLESQYPSKWKYIKENALF